jgi:hypothetical protein
MAWSIKLHSDISQGQLYIRMHQIYSCDVEISKDICNKIVAIIMWSSHPDMSICICSKVNKI